MSIIHNPITNTQVLIDHFKNKENEIVKYVCTTELPLFENRPIDIFYRVNGIPHPIFNNTYFGIFYNNDNSISICNADSVTSLEFNLLPTFDGLIYSRYRHDFVQKGEAFIDGGRAYTRATGNTQLAKVVDGKLELLK